MLRAGLYARVSTHDQQTIPLQTRAMRDYAARRGWTIVMQVKEIGSGASQRERREIDVVLVWRLARWRSSPNSSGRFCASESAPDWLRLGKTASDWAGRSQPHCMPTRSGSFTVAAVVNPRSPAS